MIVRGRSSSQPYSSQRNMPLKTLMSLLPNRRNTLVFDPGTASYYGKPPWRGMDRGTRTHPMEAPTRPEWVGPRAPLEDKP